MQKNIKASVILTRNEVKRKNLAAALEKIPMQVQCMDSSLRPDKEHSFAKAQRWISRDSVQNDKELNLLTSIVKTALSIAFCFMLLSGCAGQRMPEGGPVDAAPPEIISVYPSPQTINFADNKIVVEFSEYVDRRSVEEAIFISPNIEEKEFDWSGTEVELAFNEELRKNTTYVITIGTDVRDVRAGNRMSNAFTLSFSTGNKIDKGLIAGKVYDENPDGVMIFSYRLNDIKVDTLNPVKTKPDYLTQSGKDGNFRLTNIASGTYRLFAVRDEYRNLLYDPETDAAGTADDVTLTETDTMRLGIKFTVAKEDTTPPRIVSAQTSDNRHVAVVFSEPLDSSTIARNSFIISDTVGKNILSVQNVFPNNFQFNAFTLVTEKQTADSLYLLHVQNVVKDKSGFQISPLAQNKLFTGSAVRDTLPPSIISFTIKDSATKIFSDDSIVVMFSDAAIQTNDSAFSLTRKRDSSNVLFTAAWVNPDVVSIKPRFPLQINERYALTFRWNFLKDGAGNSWKDSSTVASFSVDDPENYGSIEGSFAGFSGESAVIEAQNIADKKQTVKKVKADLHGKFSLQRLTEGKYVLKAFDDVNMNFIHDAGSPFPFVRSEQFSYYQDTIRVRARWPVDGVMFKEK